jgi:hypothetical protein
MSIVSPLKSGKSHLSLVEGPDFATWKMETLVQFAKQAHERMKAQEEQIEALRMDVRAAMESYRKLLIESQRR